MSDGATFAELAVALSALRRKHLHLPADRPVGTLSDELDRGWAAWLCVCGAAVEIRQSLYRTEVRALLNDKILGQCVDRCRAYAEAAALFDALCNPNFHRG
jgi:hypothetical protein